MKQSILKLGLLLIVFGFALVGCSKDDNQLPEPEKVPDPVTATVNYEIRDRLDLSKYADMTVSYTNNEGKEVTEVVTSPTWKKTITKAPVPGTYKIKVTYTRNKTAMEKENYKIAKGMNISYSTNNGQNKSINSYIETNVPKDKFENYLKEIIDESSVEIKK